VTNVLPLATDTGNVMPGGLPSPCRRLQLRTLREGFGTSVD